MLRRAARPTAATPAAVRDGEPGGRRRARLRSRGRAGATRTSRAEARAARAACRSSPSSPAVARTTSRSRTCSRPTSSGSARAQAFPLDAIARAIAARLGEDGGAARRARAAATPRGREQLVASFARKNGVLGAAVFIPGADLPVLALNELRLVLRLEQAYGARRRPRERLPEIAAIARRRLRAARARPRAARPRPGRGLGGQGRGCVCGYARARRSRRRARRCRELAPTPRPAGAARAAP